jgi:AAA family ATP:ADP antiporter
MTTSVLSRFVAVQPEEIRAALWSFAYFFSVLCSYYILRPLRDEMGVTVGSDGLQWLFVIVFFVMLAAVPLFGWVVATFERRWIVPIVYGFFILNLGMFWVLFQIYGASTGSAAAFFVWVSVFNLMAVSLFWSVMADLWSSTQAKRLYGFIAAGGSAGALTGPILTRSVVAEIGPTNLLLASAVLLGIAAVCFLRLRSSMTAHPSDPTSDRQAAGGSLLAGAMRVVQSSYLRRIALWVLIANLIGTFFYLEQARIVGGSMPDRIQRVQFFAQMDLAVNVIAAVSQIFLTSHVIRRMGVGIAIAALPTTAALGLVALAISPTLAVIATVMVVERAITFALSNPAIRVLYTVVAPEEKYKAQNFIDTVVFRGGDAASGWVLNGLAKGLGAPVSLVAALALPFAALWLALSVALGREQAARAEQQDR